MRLDGYGTLAELRWLADAIESARVQSLQGSHLIGDERPDEALAKLLERAALR